MVTELDSFTISGIFVLKQKYTGSSEAGLYARKFSTTRYGSYDLENLLAKTPAFSTSPASVPKDTCGNNSQIKTAGCFIAKFSTLLLFIP